MACHLGRIVLFVAAILLATDFANAQGRGRWRPQGDDPGGRGGDSGGRRGEFGGRGGDSGGSRGEWRGPRGDSRPPSGDPSEWIKSRTERAERMLGFFDPNHDGVIEPGEVEGRSRYIYERMAKEAGLDPARSISVNELRSAVVRQIEKEAREGAGPRPPGNQPPGGGPQPGQPSAPQPKVAGFGVQGAAPKVAGFGPAAGAGAPGSAGSATRAPGSFGGSSSGSNESVRKYVDSLFEKYDENKNGTLEASEWKKISLLPAGADANNDGIITKEELARSSGGGDSGSHTATASSPSPAPASDQGQSRPRGGPWSTSSSTTGSSSSKSSSGSSGSNEKSYRFLSPLERLPKGLPDWFARKDANGDGQVSMAEYSSVWDDAKAAEFAKYDRNNDGVITPEECLAAEKAK